MIIPVYRSAGPFVKPPPPQHMPSHLNSDTCLHKARFHCRHFGVALQGGAVGVCIHAGSFPDSAIHEYFCRTVINRVPAPRYVDWPQKALGWGLGCISSKRLNVEHDVTWIPTEEPCRRCCFSSSLPPLPCIQSQPRAIAAAWIL